MCIKIHCMKNKQLRHNISLGLALGVILFTSVNAAHMSGVDQNSKHNKISPLFILGWQILLMVLF